MGRLNVDIYKRDFGWDYLTLTLPDGKEVIITVRGKTRTVLSVTIQAPKEVKIKSNILKG